MAAYIDLLDKDPKEKTLMEGIIKDLKWLMNSPDPSHSIFIGSVLKELYFLTEDLRTLVLRVLDDDEALEKSEKLKGTQKIIKEVIGSL